MLSLAVWAVAALLFDAGGRLAAVIDASELAGQHRVDAYSALAWRLLVAAVAVGVSLRAILWLVEKLAGRMERKRRDGNPRALGWIGDLAIGIVSIAFGWDRLLMRLRREALAQIVHVRFRDGTCWRRVEARTSKPTAEDWSSTRSFSNWMAGWSRSREAAVYSFLQMQSPASP